MNLWQAKVIHNEAVIQWYKEDSLCLTAVWGSISNFWSLTPGATKETGEIKKHWTPMACVEKLVESKWLCYDKESCLDNVPERQRKKKG